MSTTISDLLSKYNDKISLIESDISNLSAITDEDWINPLTHTSYLTKYIDIYKLIDSEILLPSRSDLLLALSKFVQGIKVLKIITT